MTDYHLGEPFSDQQKAAVYQDTTTLDSQKIDTVAELLTQAKRVIASGENSLCIALRKAAELIAAAQAQGASQRKIAAAIGKSASWVNRLNKWRLNGYCGGTPFGPESKASRERARCSGATKRQKVELPIGSRDLLVKTLGMLGSDHLGERDNAARTTERLRKEFGLTWDQLLIPAEEAEA